MAIVTLQQLKRHLRYDDDESDAELQLTLDMAEQAVLDYITDTFDDGDYPATIKKAILVLAGYYDSYRNAEKEAPINGNYLPQPVQSLLYKYRLPSIGGS